MKKKSSLIKDAVILCLITLISGLLLGMVHYITKEPIALAEEKAKNEAYQKVCPDAASFADSFEEELLRAEEILSAASYVSNTTVDACLTGTDSNGRVVGYVVLSTCSKSYGGDVSIATGFDESGVVTGIEVLELKDTPGLGMKAEDKDFRNQYTGVDTEYYTVTKTGASAVGEVDAISSATITSKAFTNAVNGAKVFISECIKGGE